MVITHMLLALVAQTTANPFDPAGYIETQAQTQAAEAETLQSKGIYKIDGRRFHKFTTADGSVYLPGAGEMPDMIDGAAVCEPHLALRREVLKLRDGLPIDAETRKLEKQLVALVRSCKEGTVKGPEVEILTPNGAVVQMKTKPKKGRNEKETRGKVE